MKPVQRDRDLCVSQFHTNHRLIWVMLICLSCIFHDLSGQSTDRMFRRLNLHYRDAPTHVTAILQDETGFIWLGSTDGLYRFDGYEFRAFRANPADSLSLHSNQIRSLLEDESGHIWVGSAGALQRLDPQTMLFREPILDQDIIRHLRPSSVRQMIEDQDGRIWAVLERQGLLRYDPTKQHARIFRLFADEPDPFWGGGTWGITEDDAGTIWLATFRHIQRYDPTIDHFTPISFEIINQPKEQPKAYISARGLTSSAPGELWASTNGRDLYRRNPNTGSWTGFQHDPLDPNSVLDNRMLDIYLDQSKNVWIRTVSGGLIKFDEQRQTFERYHTTRGEINSISDNKILAVCEDRNGLIWVGTPKGIDQLRPENAQFSFHHPPDIKNPSAGDNRVSALIEDQQGLVWIGTRGSGLYSYYPISKTYQGYRHNISNTSTLGDDAVWEILEDRDGRLWTTTSKGLLHLFDPSNNSFVRYALPDINHSRFGTQVRCITEDEYGRLWLGTLGNGLYSFDPNEASFKIFRNEVDNEESLSNNAVYAIQADRSGGVWAATLNGEVCYYDFEKDVFTSYPRSPESNSSTAGDNYNYSLFIDRKDRVWVGTGSARLGLFNRKKNRFKYFFQNPSDPTYIPMGITDDASGNLWLATDRGLVRFTPPDQPFASDAEPIIQQFTVDDGLQDNDFFSTTAIHQSGSGHIYVGGPLGYNLFHPDSVSPTVSTSEVILTDFKIFNKSVPIARHQDSLSNEYFLERDISHLNKVNLKYDQQVFSVAFSTDDYRNPLENRFAYRLVGFTPDWTDIGTQHSVTFTNLDPGKYTLEIKASDNKGKWSENVRSLHVVITPPWYRSRLSYLLLSCMVSALLYALYRFNLRRSLQQAEAHRVVEINRMRSLFFTNLTHEFRTPLTVIMGMAEEMKRNNKVLGDGLELIQRNSRNLLRLINELLDLSKLESGSHSLEMIHGDVVSYLEYLTESFQSMARDRNIRLGFYSSERSLLMDYDEEKLQQIVYNLLSNALKFTSTNGKVTLHIRKDIQLDKERLRMEVNDTGIGIEAEQLPHIFDRFYQGDASATRREAGTGIGLALTKELVDLLQGEIRVDSSPGVGTTFIIHLPITSVGKSQATVRTSLLQQIKPAAHQVVETKWTNTKVQSNSDAPQLLIIEDNNDVVSYLTSLLAEEYDITIADNGQTGIDLALESIPDVIISDVMMPQKDGFQVCDTLKRDERTSHIPIILLTARATDEDRIAGLQHGADAYLTKPFQRQELLVRLNNLVEIRRQLKTRFQNFTHSAENDVKINKASDRETLFLQKLHEHVESNLDNPNFGVPQLAESVLMSRVQVYRKLKALTGKTPSQFIRSIRLQRGKELILSTDKTISEIAYEIGFSDPNYFTRTFQKEFRKTPRELRQSHF